MGAGMRGRVNVEDIVVSSEWALYLALDAQVWTNISKKHTEQYCRIKRISHKPDGYKINIQGTSLTPLSGELVYDILEMQPHVYLWMIPSFQKKLYKTFTSWTGQGVFRVIQGGGGSNSWFR